MCVCVCVNIICMCVVFVIMEVFIGDAYLVQSLLVVLIYCLFLVVTASLLNCSVCLFFVFIILLCYFECVVYGTLKYIVALYMYARMNYVNVAI